MARRGIPVAILPIVIRRTSVDVSRRSYIPDLWLHYLPCTGFAPLRSDPDTSRGHNHLPGPDTDKSSCEVLGRHPSRPSPGVGGYGSTRLRPVNDGYRLCNTND